MSVQIHLDNYNGVCYPGQTLAGRVECHFDKQKNLRAIRIKFKGESETEWTESESYYDHHTKKHKTRHVTYSANETYFNAEYCLVQGGDNFSLSPGRHTYPFSYILPAELPTSFEGSYGHIRYSIKATVDRPWKFDYESKIALSLLSPLDLNYVPRAREPVKTSVDKTVGCCCWESGNVTFDVSLPVTGYVPGQDVNIGAYVENMSNVTAECVKFKITKEMEYISHYPQTKHKYESKLVCESRDGAIGAHGEKSWTSVLTIPTNERYPNLLPCGIINMHYRFKGKVVLPCPHTNLDMGFPFTIGDVPLSGVNLATPGPPPPVEYPLPDYDSFLVPQPNSFPPPAGATAPPPEVSPLLPGPTAPYPADGGGPYPPEPTKNSGPPYPSGGPPYPNAGASSQTGSAPYPPSGPPYPSERPLFPNGDTSKQGVGAPYSPSAGGAPYPPGPGGAPYPPGPGGAPYPPGAGGAPYPPGPAGAPYPPGPGGTPYPSSVGWPQADSSKASDPASAPPSYDEAKKLHKEKS